MKSVKMVLCSRLQPPRPSPMHRGWSVMSPCDFLASYLIPYAISDRPMQSPTIPGSPRQSPAVAGPGSWLGHPLSRTPFITPPYGWHTLTKASQQYFSKIISLGKIFLTFCALLVQKIPKTPPSTEIQSQSTSAF